MIPPMYELERLKVILQYGQVPPANTEERTKLYLKYQFAVCITFWCCRKCLLGLFVVTRLQTFVYLVVQID